LAGLAAVGGWLYFALAYTGRSPGSVPYARTTAGALVALGLFKVTNPIHRLYFTSSWATAPFPHLAIHNETPHWIALALSYVLAFVGVYVLLEHFQHAGADSRPLSVLVVLTGVPVALNLVGEGVPWLLNLMYEPLGVAAFALGVLFVYLERFERIHLAGEMEDGAVFLDQERRIRDYNDEALAHVPALADAIGEALADVVPALADALDTDDVFAVTEDGETRYYDVTATPFMMGKTRTGEVVVVEDVTERERYRRRLEQRTEQLEALNRVVRHDIRNDMAVVLGWGDVLREHVDDEGEDALERILGTAEHTVEITENVRDFLDALADEGEMHTEAVDLRVQLDAELARVRESYPNATFETPEGLPSVSVSANEMLSSVFRNVLNNAVQHSDVDDPTVTVRVTVGADTASVRIADDGPGVPDGQKEAVFGKAAKGERSGGSGIGLYLVRTIVEQFGGSVRVEDNEPRGAVFVVELPRAESA